MAKEATQQKGTLDIILGSDDKEKEVQLLFGDVTKEELDEWKVKYGKVYIVTVKMNDHENVTGYFKKPVRDVLANVVNMSQDKKIYEAREFLLVNTWIGGDKRITTNIDLSISAQTKLWTMQNFLTAEGVTY